MDTLKISRGNANTNLRDLIGWGLIEKVTYAGDRKEYFKAEKDVWKMFCIITRERKRREVEPAQRLIHNCLSELSSPQGEAEKAFYTQLSELADFIEVASTMMEKIAQSEKNKILPEAVKITEIEIKLS